jgi:hypothetical protein
LLAASSMTTILFCRKPSSLFFGLRCAVCIEKPNRLSYLQLHNVHVRQSFWQIVGPFLIDFMKRENKNLADFQKKIDPFLRRYQIRACPPLPLSLAKKERQICIQHLFYFLLPKSPTRYACNKQQGRALVAWNCHHIYMMP